jgi:hypothetical protein
VTVDRYAVLPSELPSVYIDSPDPMKANPTQGQVLDVSYSIKALEKKKMPYLLLLKVIYKNLEEETLSYTVFNEKGGFEFSVLDEKFLATGGVLTYKAELMTFDGDPIAEYKHKLWFDLISFD